MIKNFIFLGAPGVGKGTLAKKLQKLKGIKHISTGDIFRKEIENQTNLGLKVQKILNSGDYVPDEITNEIIKNVLDSPEVKKNGFILDGYPRTVNQALFLKNNNINIDSVILLNAKDSTILERLLNRGRKDDNLEIIKKRLEIYEEKTKPLIQFYKKENLINKVDANSQIEENFKILLKEIY